MADRKPIRRALVSVYEKSRLLELGKALHEAGVEILSTGSTAKTLADAGIAVTEVGEYTGFPEIMGGRVKTLHPRIHSGILADQNNPEHLAAIADLEIAPFDLVVINLYPFAATIASGADFAECIEQIDIGGPSMLRGAAKNHESVAVLCHESQYDQAIAALKSGGFTDEERKRLALDVFRTTAEYDLTIASWLGSTISYQMQDLDWFGLIYKRGSILIDRNKEASRKDSYLNMREVLASGMHMCIYPEGTRNKTNKPLKSFHDGAFRLAFDTGKSIIPAIIKGSKDILPHNKTFYFWPGKMELKFLAPVSPAGFADYSAMKEHVFEVMKNELI